MLYSICIDSFMPDFMYT